ncbi:MULTISPECIES: hypothetical protein [unclassified Sphingomonas]|nr:MULTISPECIES: hypothetical protein [unclassified Sphingomonas]AXJ96236.1 hypothetical protein DM480_12750 [Sphingomonas sp. FARSPH]
MQWFHSFATEGLALPAFMTGFGSLVILRASSTPMLTEDQIAAVPRWLRWLARKDSETLQRRSGWMTIACAVVVTVLRVTAAG